LLPSSWVKERLGAACCVPEKHAASNKGSARASDRENSLRVIESIIEV
jgi:hypothetical protein